MCENEASGQQAVEHLRAVLRASQNVAYRDATGLRFGDAIPAYANAVEFLRALDAAPIAPSTAAGEREYLARQYLAIARDHAGHIVVEQHGPNGEEPCTVADLIDAALATTPAQEDTGNVSE